MTLSKTTGLTKMFILISTLGLSAPAFAADAPVLGEANHFAVLAGAQINSTGATVISGEVGVNPGSVVTGFPPGVVNNGAIHMADQRSLQAQIDATTAAITLGYQKADQILTGKDLGGMTLNPGVYLFVSSATLTGKLILDAKNIPNALFIFQVGGSFTTSNQASIELVNGAKSSNVFFVTGNSATIGDGANIMGSVMASNSITLMHGAKVEGKIQALAGTVTLNENSITNVLMTTDPTPTPSPTVTPTATPDPSATPGPTAMEPVVYSMNCDFASAPYLHGKKGGGGGGSFTCHADGSVCVDGTDATCVSRSITHALSVTCNDTFAVNDQAATRSSNGSTVTVNAKNEMDMAAAIDLKSFNNKAETLVSSLTLTYSNGVQRTLSGNCILR